MIRAEAAISRFRRDVTLARLVRGLFFAALLVTFLLPFTPVSLDPLLVLVSLAHNTRTLDAIRVSRRYAVNVLHRRQRDVALAFAKPGSEFPEGHTVIDPHGYVVVVHSLAILRCEVHDIVTQGDHELVVGEVVDFEGSGGEPLIFHRGAFGGLDEDALVPRGRVIGIHTAPGW